MASERSYRIFVRDLVLLCSIGAYPHERLHPQRVRFNVDLRALWPSTSLDDDLDKVINYKDLTSGIRRLVDAGHVNLVETLAERIADLCLADARVLDARVRVEKLDVEPASAGIGVELERHRAAYPAVADLFARRAAVAADPSSRSGGGER